MFYTSDQQQVVNIERQLRSAGNIIDANKLLILVNTPQGIWLWGDAPSRVRYASTQAALKSQIPVFVIYNGPNASNVIYGSGLSNYLAMITNVQANIENRNAWIVLEPDTLPLLVNQAQGNKDFSCARLNQAVQILKKGTGTRVYLDAGHSSWIPLEVIAQLLIKAGIDKADGFSLNVSNFRLTSEALAYGEKLSKLVGGKHFIIDTSRNGKGPATDGQWANPSGRGLGQLPTENTGHPLCDALFWIKCPGESDGTQNGGPSAGQFWTSYALGLVDNAILNQPTPPPSIPPTPPPTSPLQQFTKVSTKSIYFKSPNQINIELTLE